MHWPQDIVLLSSDTKQVYILIAWLDEKVLEKYGDSIFTAWGSLICKTISNQSPSITM